MPPIVVISRLIISRGTGGTINDEVGLQLPRKRFRPPFGAAIIARLAFERRASAINMSYDCLDAIDAMR